MVRVCDAIMGTGKSSAAITYMNEHSNEKFIYITPYLDEATRIKEGCPNLKFVEPSNKIPQYQFRKSAHTAALIKEGRNITSTHQAFKTYSKETLEDIRKHGYTLIIDENLDVLEKSDIHPDDIQTLVDAGYITENDGVYTLTNDKYQGEMFHELFWLMKTRDLIKSQDEDDEFLHYWLLPPSLLSSFKNVFILTYLFKGQSLHHFMEIYKIPYEYIGVRKSRDGKFYFGDFPSYKPEYVDTLKDMIHILDNDKLNDVGDSRTALSISWFNRGGEKVFQLKNNIYNCFNNIWKDVPAEKRLCASYKSTFGKIKGKGYTKAFLNFNSRATNTYRDRTHLAYAANVFMNVNEKAFFAKHGVNIDEEAYALCTMLQCIWRSAIRDGHEIYLYIPSRRMRNLLINWIEDLSKGVNDNEM